MELRVWHIQNVPSNPKYTFVKDVSEAIILIKILIASDLKCKDVFSNVFGLSILTADGWEDWENENGESIMDVIDEMEEEL